MRLFTPDIDRRGPTWALAVLPIVMLLWVVLRAL